MLSLVTSGRQLDRKLARFAVLASAVIGLSGAGRPSPILCGRNSIITLFNGKEGNHGEHREARRRHAPAPNGRSLTALARADQLGSVCGDDAVAVARGAQGVYARVRGEGDQGRVRVQGGPSG